ncbi:MAG: hypothetical protein IJM30_12065 [Thermoguttaceae bacterium]|nr:hypothetical protein [Thermoguttaceae bacterium]
MKNERTDSLSDRDLLRNVVARTRRRLALRALLDSAGTSFLFAICGAVVYVALGVALNRPTGTPRQIVATTLAIGAIATLASFFSTRRDRREAEKALDQSGDFEDRFLTAGELLDQESEREIGTFEALQIRDCSRRAREVDPKRVVSTSPRGARTKLTLIGAAICALAFVLWKPSASDDLAAEPNEVSLDVSRELRDNLLVPIRELADANPDKEELSALSKKLRELVDEFDANLDDPKKGTSLIAQMEEEVKSAIAASGVELSDKSIKDLGGAFSSIESTRAIATALDEGDYDSAADELEKLDFEKMSARDRQALADKLKAAAATLRARKDEQTAQLTEQLADELQSGKCASCKNTACKLAGKLREARRAQDATKQLNCQLARLGLCKSNCAGACSTCAAACPSSSQGAPGEQKKAQNASAQGKSQKGEAKKPTDSIALASDPLSGEDSETDATKVLTKVSGNEGDEGDSEVETAKASEGGSSRAVRERDERDREFAKRVEEALDADSTPLERRRVVRAYFEEIRESVEESRGEE